MKFRNRRTIYSAIGRQDIDHRQLVTLPNFEIEYVVRGRDL